MARLLSIVMAVFIIVPTIAPALGLGLIVIGGWKFTFVGLAILALFLSLWFYLRMPETLAPSNRRSLNPHELFAGLREVLTSRVTLGYTIAMGLTFGSFIGYLGSAQNIFQKTFFVGDWFVVYFAIAALSIGAASLLNAKLVMRLGMRKLSWLALVALTVMSSVFWLVLLQFGGIPPLWLFLTWLLPSFFFLGILLGNVNALSLEPLGHMAGLGAAFIGSLSLLISLPLAWLIGNQYDGTTYPLVTGFAVLSFLGCGVFYWAGNGRAGKA